jgi:hypothetical protein
MDRLKRAGISDEEARAHAEAMDEALRESVATNAFVQSEITRLETRIASDIARAVRDMTIRMGMMAVALFAALASIQFFG